MINKSSIAFGILVSCLFLSSPVHAAIVFNSAVGGQPLSGVNYLTFDNIPLGSAGGAESGVTLSLDPDAEVVLGASSGLYAAPVVSNGNGANFGPQADGVDATRYVTSGKNVGTYPNAKATLTFASDQWYFGLLWGSVDTYNTLTFYDVNDNVVGTLTGGQVASPANGNQNAQGTVYVNVFADTGFRSVVATSSQYAFEFDNVAYAVPEPAAMLVWGFLSLVGLCVVRHRRKA